MVIVTPLLPSPSLYPYRYLGEASLTMDDLFCKLSAFVAEYGKAKKEHAKLMQPGMVALLTR